MIDFKNKAIFKLAIIDNEKGREVVKDILIEKEKILFSFKSMRDSLIITDKRIISANVQGITGKKVDYTSIPYHHIQSFSVETAGTIDLDAELDITISGLGTIRFELKGETNVKALSISLANLILK